MARRSLKPQLNQIRAWVRQGRTDAWIAHQLEVSATELREFRKQHDLTPDDENAGSQRGRPPRRDRGRDRGGDRRGGGRGGGRGRGARRRRGGRGRGRRRMARRPRTARRRGRCRARAGGAAGRRGGRGRRKELEATFDHGETDGYGLWLDASVKDNPVYAEHWAGKREVTVRIDADQIVIRRAGGEEPDDDAEADLETELPCRPRERRRRRSYRISWRPPAKSPARAGRARRPRRPATARRSQGPAPSPARS